ncbi:MAG: LamG domain-containing protein, partial [Patescibacteria group bacterium]|nr:LamG domain-containing protein [Patescibacteria group bacterium]
LLAQSRDSARLSDMASLNSAINIYLVDSAGTGFLGTSSVVYVSLPDTASSTCGDLGLPLLPSGYSYNCVSTTSLVKTDGTGWLPVKLASTSSGTPLGSLPKDPTNASSSNLYYTYVTDGNGNYELTMLPESQKYASAAATDGGIDPAMYETGNKLTLSPFAHGMVGYWPMNEGNGTVVYDQSGYGNNGNINDFNGDANLSNTIQWQQGNCISNYCLHFIGTGVASTTGRVIMIGNNTKNSTSSITLMGWIDDLATPPGWELYFSLGLDDHLDFNNFRSMLSTADRSSYSIYPSPTLNISLSTWHFLALTYDGSIAKEYFDGQQVGSLVINKLLYQESATLTQINGWQLYDNGQYYTASSTLQNNIREYNHALSATEIQAIYNAKQ